MNNILENLEVLDVPDAETKAPPPKARLLSELVRPKSGDDPDELLQHRFLCRGGGMLFCGPTGVGKSSFAMQAMICWALNRPHFGIASARPLKSLLIQAENDDCDMAEMRDGVSAGLELNAGDEKHAWESIAVMREDSHTGLDFFLSVVRPLVAEHRPHLLWIDPAFAYLGGEAAAQREVTPFLRNYLNPLVREFGCAPIVCHHSNKPPAGKEKSNWSGNDFAYLGSGSIEWANWARAIIAIRGIGAHNIFELHAAKRGARLGWKDAEGATSFAKLIGWSKEPGLICWREVDPDEIEKKGRPKSCDPAELLALLPPEGLATGKWMQLADTECGVSGATFHRERRALKAADSIIKSKVSGKWQPVKTNEVSKVSKGVKRGF